MKDLNVTIVGLGLIGGTYALGLKKAGVKNLYAIDINMDTIDKAKKIGMIDDGGLDPKPFLEKSDLIIIGLYPNIITKFIRDNKDSFKDGAVLTDVAGIKEKYIDEIINILPTSVDFVFAHPMAGREKVGMEHADINIFKGANFIITPTKVNKDSSIQLIENMAKSLGFKTINKISANEHDEIIAFTSQLTHAIAVSLVNSDEQKLDTNRFIGDSYRDLTRIAMINPELWSQLFIENKEFLIKKIEKFEDELDNLKKAISEEDYDTLYEKFNESTKRRQLIN